MKRLFNLLLLIFKSKKISSVEKKKIVIFDCTNSDILSEILPKDQTYLIKCRIEKIDKLLINLRLIKFLLKNFFSRKMTLNYFIYLIDQIEPKFILTTIDNSVTFSKLTKYYENKIKFIAVQNSTRGDIYENNKNYNKYFYFTNYIGLSNFDLNLLQKKNIKIKNFIAGGSLKNSYFKFNLNNCKNEEKKFDICIISKRLFNGNTLSSSYPAKSTLQTLRFLAKYIKKYGKSIIIQSKFEFNNLEKNLYEKFFENSNYKIIWRDKSGLVSYKSMSSSKIVTGAPTTSLREAFAYNDTKVLCFDLENKKDKHPFPEFMVINEISYEKFEKKLNLLFNLNYDDYLAYINDQNDHILSKVNTVNCILDELKH